MDKAKIFMACALAFVGAVSFLVLAFGRGFAVSLIIAGAAAAFILIRNKQAIEGMKIASEIRRAEFGACIKELSHDRYLYHKDVISVAEGDFHMAEATRMISEGKPVQPGSEQVQNRVFSAPGDDSIGEGSELTLNDQVRAWYREGVSKNKILKKLGWKKNGKTASQLNEILERR
jgi:hypothetical protein